jgi:hypothetical protein
VKTLLLAATALLGFSVPYAANAALITGFSQEPTTNTVTATDNGTTTTISYTDVLTTLGGGILGSIPGATMSLSATSIDAAILIAGNIIQHYSGTFCISSVAGCGGNFLSGTFTDAAFGGNGGPGLTVNVNNPPESLVLTSNVLPASVLIPPNSFSLGFSNVTPTLHIDGTTIGAFTASYSGTVSSEAAAVSEPAGLALMGIGLLGLTMVRYRRS